jgi:hypothetical protein
MPKIKDPNQNRKMFENLRAWLDVDLNKQMDILLPEDAKNK